MAPFQITQYIFITKTPNMDPSALPLHPFPLLHFIPTPDIFAFPPTSLYDPSVFLLPTETSIIGSGAQVKKQEATQSGYIIVEGALSAGSGISRVCKQKKNSIKKEQAPTLDGDYLPHESSRTAAKPQVKQKWDRNLIPNAVHQLINFIQQHYKSNYLAAQIISRINPKPDAYTLSRFYNFHRMLRGTVNSYVNEAALEGITRQGGLDQGEYAREEQKFYCLLSRVMVRHFLRREAVMLILRSKKVKKENIPQHLSVFRYLYENMICEEF